jgi:hypothetical protein
MPSNNALIQGIRNRLGNAVGLGFTSSDLSDLYEAYIFSILIRAARNEGATISYRDTSNNISPSLIFRQSPGQIYTTTQPFTHAVLEFPDKPILEAHIGIRVQGWSGVLHECDLCVLFQGEAVTCRAQQCEPRQNQLIIAIECKYYTSQLQLGLGRNFLGLASELRNVQQDIYFISNTSSEHIERLLSKHSSSKRKWERNIIPSSKNELHRLMYSFQRNFKDFKAAN